jgi:DNA-binding IclR family transcriptional regulator
MRAGERHSLAATATGRVFLAHDADADVDAYIARCPDEVRHESVGSPAELWAAIAEIRERGYAWVTNAKNTGGWGVRHPVYRHDGQIAAVVSVACPRDRFTDEFRDRCLEASLRVAREISGALGYSGPATRLHPGPSSAAPPRVGAAARPSRTPLRGGMSV